jgi:multisubunit Na+/H+ antiporter MnhG subunit
MSQSQPAPSRFPKAQTVLLTIGALYLLWGIIGFFFLGDPANDFAGSDTGRGPLGLETNGLQNLVHVVIGLIALVSTSNETAMRVGGIILLLAGAGMAAVGVLGMFRPDLNVFSQNVAVTVVHAVTGLTGLVIAVVRVPAPEGQASAPPHP